MNKLITLLFCLATIAAKAACPNGVCYTTPDRLSVGAAYILSTDGDRIEISTGDVYWNQTLTVSKGITIAGVSGTQTIIRSASTVSGRDNGSFNFIVLTDGGNNSIPRRITKIGFRVDLIANGTDRVANGIVFANVLSYKRVDHCYFNDMYCAVWARNSYGLTDHNVLNHVGYSFRHSEGGTDEEIYMWDHGRNCGTPTNGVCQNNAPFNSLNYVFHEDETIDLTGDAFVCDQVGGNSWATRHCLITLHKQALPYTDAQCFTLFDSHGDNAAGNGPTAGQLGGISLILMDNTLVIEQGCTPTECPQMSLFQFRGGQAVVGRNAATGGTAGVSMGVEMREERNEYGFTDAPVANGRSGSTCAIVSPQWPHWATRAFPWNRPEFEDWIHNTYIFQNTLNGVAGGPWENCANYPVNNPIHPLNAGANPTVCPYPQCVAWTEPPANLDSGLLPTYPHPLNVSDSATGSCCQTSGACTITTQAACTGTWTNAGVCSPNPCPSPTPNPTNFVIPANTGTITTPFVVNGDNSVSQPNTTNEILGGEADYFINVVEDASFNVLGTVNWPSTSSNLFYVQIDGQPSSPMKWTGTITSGNEVRYVPWQDSIIVGNREWFLTIGLHRVVVRGGEGGTKLFSISVNKAP